MAQQWTTRGNAAPADNTTSSPTSPETANAETHKPNVLHHVPMNQKTIAATAALLALSACGQSEPETTATVTAKPAPTASATTASPTPTHSPTLTPSTPAELAAAYRQGEAATAPWRFPVTSIGKAKDGAYEVLTTLTSPVDQDLATDICGATLSFLIGDDALARVRVRVRDADLRLIADNHNGRCAAH